MPHCHIASGTPDRNIVELTQPPARQDRLHIRHATNAGELSGTPSGPPSRLSENLGSRRTVRPARQFGVSDGGPATPFARVGFGWVCPAFAFSPAAAEDRRRDLIDAMCSGAVRVRR